MEIPRAARPTGAMEPAGFPRQTVFAVKLPRTLLPEKVGYKTSNTTPNPARDEASATALFLIKSGREGSRDLFPQLPTRTPIPGTARRGPGHARRNLTHRPDAIGSAAMKLNAPRSIPPSTGGADMLIESKTQFCRHRSSSLHASSIADSQPVVSGKVGGAKTQVLQKRCGGTNAGHTVVHPPARPLSCTNVLLNVDQA